ncbi:MAG TPA: DUF1691 domain-containing protein [Planctomycetota bacterium]
MTVARLQAISGILFAAFLILHLATTTSAVGGPATYDAVLEGMRNVYRPHLVVELLLIGLAGSVHIVCGIVRIIRRRRDPNRVKPSLVVRIHHWAGYVLLLAIAGHVFATRVMPALATGPTATGKADFSYLAYSVTGWPLFMKPYYVLLGAAGAIHLGLGLGLAAGVLFGGRADPRKLQRFAVGGAAVLTVLVVCGVLSIIRNAPRADRSRFAEFRVLYERFLPFMMGARQPDE